MTDPEVELLCFNRAHRDLEAVCERLLERQADWFIREVKRCRDIGMPLGCCDYWPECAHVFAWTETRAGEADND